MPGSDNDSVLRRITSQLAIEENSLTDWETNDNVVRVKNVLGENMFNNLFPIKDSFYTYENFLHAVAKFP